MNFAMDPGWLLKRPVISEKSTEMLGKLNIAQFIVDKKATKPQIKHAVEKAFSVKVKSVRVANYLGKMKRHQQMLGRRSSFKKAFVELFPGQKISIFEQVS
jgi:large subunit ribosomal protein L23